MISYVYRGGDHIVHTLFANLFYIIFKANYFFSSFFEHVKGKFTEVLEPRKIETDSIATMFKRILQIPFLRLKDYGKLVSKLALKYPAVSVFYALILHVFAEMTVRRIMSKKKYLPSHIASYFHSLSTIITTR